jgi:CheY-like chemotaxis protein
MTTQQHAVQGRRILLVDDERAVRELVRELLSRDKHTVVEANNGAEAFGLFGQHRFDLVVTDARMPFLAGNELAARIRRVAPRQPILMLTAYGDQPGQDNPVNAVLPKPFDLSQFRAAVAKLIFAAL